MINILNIGLARNDGKPDNTMVDVISALGECCLLDHGIVHRIVNSNTEQTAIVTLDNIVRVSSVYELSEKLAQDCIALYSPRVKVGFLIGPYSRKWGKFDFSKFIMP